MDSSPSLEPTSTPGSSQMLDEEASLQASGSHPHPEMLIKDLRNLTLNTNTKLPAPVPEDPQAPLQVPDTSRKVLREARSGFPYRQKGVRTLLSEQRERMATVRYLTTKRYLIRSRYAQNIPGVPFRCTCTYCLYYAWDPSENAKIGYDGTESAEA